MHIARTRHTAEHDVVIVGARCAGAATARLLAQRGHDVLVLDRAHFPSDTLSTHAIARGGVVQLARWGLLDAVLDSGAPAIRQTAFHMGGATIRRTVKDRAGVDLLVAPRRHVLDPLLLDAAHVTGAAVRTGVTVRDVVRNDGGRVVGVLAQDGTGRSLEVRARFVVGADGVTSRVARAVDAPMAWVERSLGATHYAYFEGDWPAMEYYVGDGAFAGIFPTNDGQACIWVCMPADHAELIRRQAPSLEAAFTTMVDRASPALRERLRDRRASDVRGTMRLPNHVRRCVGQGWALVGDAGYHRDPVTGHGITDALRDAELLACALDRSLRRDEPEMWALQAYQAERDEMIADIFRITVALAEFPPPNRFVELQKELGQAMDDEATALAARPRPGLLLAA